MLKRLNKHRKGQNTAEYAILIALVVAAVIAMQTFVKRALQARSFDATSYMRDQTTNAADGLDGDLQYEPYYLTSQYNVYKDSAETKSLQGTASSTSVSDTKTTREAGGFSVSNYEEGGEVGGGMQ